MRYESLSQHPRVFLSATGLRVGESERLYRDILPAYQEAKGKRLERPER